MKLTKKQREKILTLFPKQRGKVVVSNDRFLDALVYIVTSGCTWRSLPPAFGPWHTIYVRINRWARNGVLERVFQALRDEQVVFDREIRVVSLDSTTIKARPGAARALQKQQTGVEKKPGRVGREDAPVGGGF